MPKTTIHRTLSDAKGRNLDATINKNFIVAEGGLYSQGAHASELQVLLCLLALCQFTDNRTLRFDSRFQMLKLLQWNTSLKYYDKLDDALEFWSLTTFDLDWYQNKQHAPKSVKVLSVLPSDDGKTIVRFDRAFYSINAATEAYWCKIYYGEAKFPDPQPMLLHMLLCAMSPGLSYGPEALAEKVGMQDSKLNCIVPQIRKWLAAISARVDTRYTLKVKGNLVQIAPGKAKEEQKLDDLAVEARADREPELRTTEADRDLAFPEPKTWWPLLHSDDLGERQQGKQMERQFQQAYNRAIADNRFDLEERMEKHAGGREGGLGSGAGRCGRSPGRDRRSGRSRPGRSRSRKKTGHEVRVLHVRAVYTLVSATSVLHVRN